MRSRFLSFVCFAVLASAGGFAADHSGAVPAIILPEVGSAAGSQFSPAQLAFVQSWIRQQAPECPLELSAAAAQAFLEELSLTQPEKFDRLLAVDFPVHSFDSMLLRVVGTKLGKPAQSEARAIIALRRVTALLTREGLPASGVAAQLEKMRDESDYQYRRLVEGRIEDDDLLTLWRKSVSPAERAPVVTGGGLVPAKVLSAAEIVSEFSRHNQAGAALQRLQAYVVEGRLKTAAGETQQIVVSKMRPDYVRFVMIESGQARYVLGAEGDRFWQQVPGQPPQFATGQALGSRRYATEFADPLFAGDRYAYERLPDGTEGGKSFHRIQVRRPDGSSYVARIEPGTYHQIGRENPDQSIARYADFREIGGVIFAFREEITDATGKRAQLELTRLTPNPGLIEAYFRPPGEPGFEYRQVEQFLLPAPAVVTPLMTSR